MTTDDQKTGPGIDLSRYRQADIVRPACSDGTAILADDDVSAPLSALQDEVVAAGKRRLRRLDGCVRLLGLSLLGSAYAMTHVLMTLVRADPAVGTGGYGAAATGFVCACSGAAMLCLGAHIFDKVEVADRWRRRG